MNPAEVSRNYLDLVNIIDSLTAERDALQARLDAVAALPRLSRDDGLRLKVNPPWLAGYNAALAAATRAAFPAPEETSPTAGMTCPTTTPHEVERRYVTDADFHARVDVGVRAAQEFRQSWRGGPDERFHTMQIALAFAATDAATDTVQVPHDGAALIAAERRRQVEQEGWTAEHDSEHQDDSLALAAISYAIPDRLRNPDAPPYMWPWHPQYWKPTPDDRVRELIKAGALLASEIDRLHRGEVMNPAEVSRNYLDLVNMIAKITAERDEARARLAEVGDLHQKDRGVLTDSFYCDECAFDWPCRTYLAAFPAPESEGQPHWSDPQWKKDHYDPSTERESEGT